MAIPDYFTREPGKKKKSKAQEDRVAKKMAGRTQAGSGAFRFNKGDIKTIDLLIEAKRTDKDSLSVKKEWLIKISEEARGYNKVPALSIEFDKMPASVLKLTGEVAPPLVEKDWIAVPASFLRQLIDVYQEMMAEHERDGSH